MKRFQSILVVPVTARSEPPPALLEAVALADTSGAAVEILGHIPDAPACERRVAGSEQALLRRAHRRSYEARLRGWAEQVDAPNLPIHIASGSLPLDVADRVRADGHDLVVVAGDGSAESTTAARRILRTCPCPVWLLRPGFTGARVLAAIDPDHGPDHNRLILELAHSQAALHSGRLHVVHAWDLPALDAAEDPDPPPLDRDQLSALTTAIEAAHRTSLDAAIDAVELTPEVRTHLVDGPAAPAIQGLVMLYRTDLVVMGAGAWEDPRLGLGSTTEQVLAETECSVLVVRRPGPAEEPGV